jgi:hypothetical protein
VSPPHRVATQANEATGDFEFLVFVAQAFELDAQHPGCARQRTGAFRHLR